nr:MAG TPA: hypothetical protein [Caudoviricetes sp.]
MAQDYLYGSPVSIESIKHFLLILKRILYTLE